MSPANEIAYHARADFLSHRAGWGCRRNFLQETDRSQGSPGTATACGDSGFEAVVRGDRLPRAAGNGASHAQFARRGPLIAGGGVFGLALS
jgi:hypothetical protein